MPKIIEEKVLGSAYCLIFWVQNIGLCLVPLLIGYVLDAVNASNPTVQSEMAQLDKWKEAGVDAPAGFFIHYDYTIPMIIFAGFGILALLFAFYLKSLDKRNHYGLELPNIVNAQAEEAEVESAEE